MHVHRPIITAAGAGGAAAAVSEAVPHLTPNRFLPRCTTTFQAPLQALLHGCNWHQPFPIILRTIRARLRAQQALALALVHARRQQELALVHVPSHRVRQEHHGAAATSHEALFPGATTAAALDLALNHNVAKRLDTLSIEEEEPLLTLHHHALALEALLAHAHLLAPLALLAARRNLLDPRAVAPEVTR